MSIKKNMYSIMISIFISCDIPGILIIQNNSGAKASYKMYVKKSYAKDVFDSGFQLDIDRSFELIELDDKEKVQYVYGLGMRWTNRRVKAFCSNLDSIKIVTKQDTLVISDQRELQKFFKKRRKYVSRNLVEIEIQ